MTRAETPPAPHPCRLCGSEIAQAPDQDTCLRCRVAGAREQDEDDDTWEAA